MKRRLFSLFGLLLLFCTTVLLVGNGFVASFIEDNDSFSLKFCHWPPPYTLSKITPEFRVYLQDGSLTNFTISNEDEVNVSMSELDRSNFFRVGRPVVFVVHGFRDVIDAGYMIDIKNGLLAVGDFTVFLVGWPKGSYLSPLNYAQAASNTQTVGGVIAMLAKAILNVGTFNGNKTSLYLYCIGHSLGAHVCGLAGLKSTVTFDRMSGLDPAGPGFADCPSNPSLTSRSADCVDAIHTDGNFSGHIDPIIPHQGSLQRWGFVDFYPNGGVNQPGCSIYDNDFRACSHGRSVKLFIYSLRKASGVCTSRGPCRDIKRLPDRSCDDGGKQQSMGYYSTCHENVNRGDRKGGVFYLAANAEDPYC